MRQPSHPAPIYVYSVETSAGQTYLTVAPSIDNAAQGIEDRFNLPAGSCKARTLKIDGAALKVFPHPLVYGRRSAELENAEQCWAPVNHKSDRRCQNPARAGFHTCKIHTLFDAPFPAGTPEYREWIEKPLEDDADKPARRRTRRSPGTRAAAKEITPAKPAKPAKRRSGARRKPANP